MGEIAYPPQQASGDSGRAACAPGDLGRAVGRDREAEQPGGAAHHQLQLVDRIILQADRDAETVAQRRREQALPRRRADEREVRQIDPHAACRRALSDHQVERAILHRRIEDLLDCGGQAVDLVDEEDVALFEIGEQGRQIARFDDDRPRCGAKAHAELARDDLRERGLAQPWRAEEQYMVERLAAGAGRLDEDAQILARALLADELVERARAKRRIGIFGRAGRGDQAIFVTHAWCL